MKRKINKYDDFVNEEFDFSIDSFKSLLNKVKSLVSKKQIDEFIKTNRAEIERVQDLLEDEKGKIDYKKALGFVKENIKKKNG